MSLVKFRGNQPSLFNRFFDDDLFDWVNRNYSTTNTTLPSVNIRENNGAFEVEVAAPGLSKEDFNINLSGDTLTVSSEKKEKNETKEGERFTRMEFSYQSFSRSFTLPDVVDDEKIEAKYEDGILRIIIPKKDEAITKPVRQIAIS